MGRTPKEDYVPLMIGVARRMLEAGEEVRISAIAAELDVSPSLVNFYFGDRQSLVDAAWKEIFLAYVADDQDDVVSATAAGEWEGVRALVERVFAPDRDTVHLTHTRAAVEARRNERLAEIIGAVHDETIAGWVALVRAAVSEGVAADRLDAEALATLIVAVPMGVAVVRPELDDDQRAHIAEAWYTMIRAVLDPAVELPFAPG